MTPEDIELLSEVSLLGILKKQQQETLNDVRLQLADTGMFTLKESKQIFKLLRQEGFIDEVGLTLKGIAKAQEAQKRFGQN